MKKLLTACAVWLLSATIAYAQIINGAYPNTFVNGTVIDATQVNANFNYAQSQANANAAKNGTNSDITALTALSTPLTPAQGGTNIYYAGTATGTANAIVVASPTPINFTLAVGKTVRFIASATNTGAATLAAGGTAATNIFKQTPGGAVALTGGEIVSGALIECYYDGTQYQLLSNVTENGGFGPLASVATAATIDLGTFPSHNVYVTGGGTITSFGASASTTFPYYRLEVAAATTISSGASLLVPSDGQLVLNTGDVIDLFWNGSIWQVTNVASRQRKFAPTGANALIITNNGVTPNTKMDITATEVVMDNGSGGNYYTESYGTCTINFSVNGAGGLDTGTIGVNSWYYLYAISTGSTNSCLASLSSSAPTMPAGYGFKVRLGAVLTVTSVLTRIMQRGNTAHYIIGTTPASPYTIAGPGTAGNCTTPTWVSAAWNNVLAPTATRLHVTVITSTNAIVAVAPNGAYPSSGYLCSVYTGATSSWCELIPESTSLSWCSNGAGGALLAFGWTDAVNAN